MRARIFALDAHLDYEQILSELMKSLAMLRYLIPLESEWDDYSSVLPSHDTNPEQE